MCLVCRDKHYILLNKAHCKFIVEAVTDQLRTTLSFGPSTFGFGLAAPKVEKWISIAAISSYYGRGHDNIVMNLLHALGCSKW